MAKKAPKEYKPGQHVIVKLSNGRIEEAFFKTATARSCKWIFGHDETALVELSQVMED